MLAFIFGKLLAAPVIGAILQPLINGALSGYQAHLTAIGSHEAAVVDIAQKSIALDQREAEVNANIIIAEQGNWFTRSVRPALAWIVIILLAKILLYDKAFGEWTGGHTDALDPKLWGVVMVIITAYMGGRTAEKVADKISGIFNKSKTGG